jgi:hypothetical protein
MFKPIAMLEVCSFSEAATCSVPCYLALGHCWRPGHLKCASTSTPPAYKNGMGPGVIGLFFLVTPSLLQPGCLAPQRHTQPAPYVHNNWRLHCRSVGGQTQVLPACALMLREYSILRIT